MLFFLNIRFGKILILSVRVNLFYDMKVDLILQSIYSFEFRHYVQVVEANRMRNWAILGQWLIVLKEVCMT